MDRRVQEDGTVIVGGQVVPTGGSQPTIASVVSYSGNAGLQSTNVEGALDELDNEKAPIVHTHDDRYFTELEVTNLLADKAASSHTHDDRYFTELEVTNLLAGKSATSHLHDDRYYTETEVDQKIAAALATTELHENAKFDIVTMSTDGPGDTTVPARLYPPGWSNYWSNGTGADQPAVQSDSLVSRLGSGYSLRVDHPTAASGMALSSSIFAVGAGSVVTVKGYAISTGPRAMITVLTSPSTSNPDFFNPEAAVFETSATVPSSSVWQEYSVTLVVPAGHTKCSFKLRSYSDAPGAPGSVWWDDSASSMQVIPPSGVVTGEIKMWPTTAAPSGYLLCQGGTFSSTTYPALAALLGDTFGTHSGTTYYLPDFRARSPIGVGGVVVPAAGSENYSIGQKWGDSRVPSHTHSGSTGIESVGHTHQYQEADNSTNAQFTVAGGTGMDNKYYRWGTTGTQSANHTHSFTSADHNSTKQTSASGNVHPVLGINFIIKAA